MAVVIVYAFENKKGQSGIANVVMPLVKSLISEVEFMVIQENIADKYKLKTATITNIIPLKEKEDE